MDDGHGGERLSDESVAVDLAIFAHNEETCIATLIRDLGRQSVFKATTVDVRVLMLANGCRDATVEVAQAAVAELPEAVRDRIEILDLEKGGKSRTAHHYIHRYARPDASILGFMDADIRLPEHETLERMIDQMRARPELHVFTSRPIKDVNHDKLEVGPVARLIARGGDGLTNYRKSICGQLYMLRGETARQIGLPVGLPVEDGFMRAMVLTDLLTRDEDLSRIDGQPDIFHVYESIRSLRELLHHQTRLVVGSAINATLYRRIRAETQSLEGAHRLLMQAGEDADWLPRVLREELPRLPYGYIPFRIARKRLTAFRAAGRRSLRDVMVLGAGIALDSIVYLRANLVMMRGNSSGFW